MFGNAIGRGDQWFQWTDGEGKRHRLGMMVANIFKGLWKPWERRKQRRAPVHFGLKFRIVDGKDPTIRSRLVDGEVLDISVDGLGIGTNTVQIDGLHIFHPASTCKNSLEIEVELSPDLPSLRTLAEVRWYKRTADDAGWIYKMGVNWESLNVSERKALKDFLKVRNNP